MAIGGVKLQREALKQMAPATTYVDAVVVGASDSEVVPVPSGAVAVSFGYDASGAWVKFGTFDDLTISPAIKPVGAVSDGTASAYSPTSRTIDSAITGISIYNASASSTAVSLEWYLG